MAKLDRFLEKKSAVLKAPIDIKQQDFLDIIEFGTLTEFVSEIKPEKKLPKKIMMYRRYFVNSRRSIWFCY